MRLALKRTAQAIALLLALPAGALCGFGRWHPAYVVFAQGLSLLPGFPGSYLRTAFYRLTLASCSPDMHIAIGSYILHPESVIERNVSIGAYCVISSARIGAFTQIASLVQITGGRRQHDRESGGGFGAVRQDQNTIGARCWIGASAIIMADVGEGSTVGAGAVVVKPVPPDTVVVGNPARELRRAQSITADGGSDE